MSLDETARTTIAPYVSSSVAEVFSLVGLPEEEVAVLFAQAARSPQTLRSNLAKLLSSQQLESRSFREGILQGYGHRSANEHAVIHLGLEGPSILASKLVEDARLASFTERLTRMAPVDPTMLVSVPEIGALNDVYRSSAEKLFTTYVDLLPRV